MGTKALQYYFHTDRELDILAERLHPVSGARLKLAALNDRCRGAHPGAKSYVVFWAAPWQKTIRQYKAFPTLIGAKRCFSALANVPPPVSPALRHDFQRAKVYAWEWKFIHNHSPSNMGETQLTRIIQRISDDFNMQAPSVNILRKTHPRTYSAYFPQNHAIDLVSRRFTHAVHEAGHGVDMIINENQWSDHGPSFVRTIIRLADRYQIWQDPVELEEEARKMGILIADDGDLPPLPGP